MGAARADGEAGWEVLLLLMWPAERRLLSMPVKPIDRLCWMGLILAGGGGGDLGRCYRYQRRRRGLAEGIPIISKIFVEVWSLGMRYNSNLK